MKPLSLDPPACLPSHPNPRSTAHPHPTSDPAPNPPAPSPAHCRTTSSGRSLCTGSPCSRSCSRSPCSRPAWRVFCVGRTEGRQGFSDKAWSGMGPFYEEGIFCAEIARRRGQCASAAGRAQHHACYNDEHNV